jgi:hypothetical protein
MVRSFHLLARRSSSQFGRMDTSTVQGTSRFAKAVALHDTVGSSSGASQSGCTSPCGQWRLENRRLNGPGFSHGGTLRRHIFALDCPLLALSLSYVGPMHSGLISLQRSPLRTLLPSTSASSAFVTAAAATGRRSLAQALLRAPFASAATPLRCGQCSCRRRRRSSSSSSSSRQIHSSSTACSPSLPAVAFVLAVPSLVAPLSLPPMTCAACNGTLFLH